MPLLRDSLAPPILIAPPVDGETVRSPIDGGPDRTPVRIGPTGDFALGLPPLPPEMDLYNYRQQNATLCQFLIVFIGLVIVNWST